MASLQLIKTRIGSVQNTAKVTKAMQMVSASKMLKAQDRSSAATPYSRALAEMFGKIGKVSNFSHPFLEIREPKKICFLIIGPSRGFVGGLIANLLVEIAEKKEELEAKYPGAKFTTVTMHKIGMKVAQNLGIESDFHFDKFIDRPSSSDITSLKKVIEEKFANCDYDEVYLCYSRFVNTARQEPAVQLLLPIGLEEILSGNDEKKVEKEYVFEPDAHSILGLLIPEYFENQIYVALLQSIACEHSARMVAMKNATDNANKLKGKLTLYYNRTRQAQITQELIEIVSGSSK